MRLKALTALFAFAACTSAIAGDWSKPTYDDADHGYYTTVKSERFNNSVFGMWAYPEQDCEPFMGVITMMEERLKEREADVTIQIRVDGGEIHTLEGVRTQQHHRVVSDGKIYRTRIIDMFTFEVEMLRDMIEGVNLIQRNLEDDMPTDEFSLHGSNNAMSGTIDACEALMRQNEWGEGENELDEWKS